MGFMMLNIASRALAAQQLALDVTGNNMANATTPGYRAETANLTEAPPTACGIAPRVRTRDRRGGLVSESC